MYLGCFFMVLVLSFINIYLLIPSLMKIFPIADVSTKVLIGWDNAIERFMLMVILGPFVETLVFIFAPIKILEDKMNVYSIGLISCVVFSLTHFYSLQYVFLSFFTGVYLFASFLLFKKKYSINIAFFSVSMIHLLNNLYHFILK